MSQTIRPTNGTDVSNALHDIYHPIQAELGACEEILVRELTSDVPWIEQLLQHSRMMGGKRMRPVFLLLTGGCCGPINDAHLNMAAALEMIHTASLIHDDVLDHAETRRHEPTANSKWGNKTSVLLGDYLFTHAFEIASRTGSPEAIRILASAGSRVCAGEIRQNNWAGNFDISEKQYLGMISEKTGELCGCGCRLGALLSNAGPEAVAEFDQFGQNVGISFQIIDDILDLVGTPSKVGKTLGTDIANQKPTLPIIHALTTAAAPKLLDLLSNSRPVNEILEVLETTGSIQYAYGVATEYANTAVQFAKGLPDSKYALGLIAAAQFVIKRKH